MRRLLLVVASALLAVVAVFVATGLLYRPDPSPLRLSRRVATVDGTPISYHQQGSGRDVVLVHGGMGSAEDFEPVLNDLAADFRVTAVDRPGFGLSHARGDDATYPGNARLVGGLVRELGLVRPVVVGHSHGGGVALQLAEDLPHVPSALVLLAPAAYPADGPSLLDRFAALPLFGEGMAAWIGPLAAPSVIGATLERMVGPDAARVPADFMAYRQELWTNPRSLAVNARQATSNVAGLTAISSRLDDIRVPSVVIACSQDPEEGHGLDSRRLTRELQSSELLWLEGCGHYIQYAYPELVVATVRTMADHVATQP